MDAVVPVEQSLSNKLKLMYGAIVKAVAKGQGVLSLTISSGECKLAYYIDDGEKGIDFCHLQALPEEASAFAWISNPKLLEKLFQQLAVVINEKISDKEKVGVIITLKDYTFYEQLELPCLAPEEMQEALAWEVPEHVPWPEASFEFQYKTNKTAEMTESQEAEVELARLQKVDIYAVEKSCISSILKAAKAVGWKIWAITVAESFDSCGKFLDNLRQVDFYEAFYTREKLAELREMYKMPILAAMLYLENQLEINFLPQEDKYKLNLSKWNNTCNFLTCTVLVMTIILGAGSALVKIQDKHKAIELQQKERQCLAWEERKAKLEQLRLKTRELKTIISQVEQQRISWRNILKELGRAIPQGVWLVRLEQQEAEQKKQQPLMVTGCAQNSEVVNLFVRQLENSKSFTSIELLKTEMGTGGKKAEQLAVIYRFSLKLQLAEKNTKKS